MKILHLITSMDPTMGGPRQGVHNISVQLKKLGLKPEVLCLNDPQAIYLQDYSLPLHALGAVRGSWGYHHELQSWLKNHLYRFDIVILHGIWQYPNLAVHQALLAMDQNNRPRLLVMPHGMLDPYFQKAESRRWKAMRNLLYWHLVQKRIINSADGVLFTTQPELELARTTFSGYRPKRELMVGYGIQEPPRYRKEHTMAFQQQCPNMNGQPFLLFLGRIHEKKGVDLLLQAYAGLLSNQKISQRLPHIVLAGPGRETAYGQYLDTLIAASPGMKHSVHWCGMLQGDAKWGAIYAAEAFVLPSHQENFGIAVVEALACSVPVLLSREVNIFRDITEAGAGYATDDTLEGTRQLLLQWLQTTTSGRTTMRTAARNLFLTRFEISATALRFAQVLWQVVRQSPLPPQLCSNPSTTTPTQALPSPAATDWQG